MKVVFFKGNIRGHKGKKVPAQWAQTPFGMMGVAGGDEPALRTLESISLEPLEEIAVVDLTGLDREGVEVIVLNILSGNYLDKPGVKGGGDAVLFILVNEALHVLSLPL